MLDEKVLKSEEIAIYKLRSLYGKYGYLPFKMSKFEEYDLYVKNKDFLISDSVITFNDTNGKLLALKPDVTLSIIKNGKDENGVKQKVYYNENVYRISGSTRQFKEIMQTGIECIGDVDIFDTFEVLSLALKSLNTVSSDFVLDISHLGVLGAMLDTVCISEDFRCEIMASIKQKNAHEIDGICEKYQIDASKAQLIKAFVEIYGSPSAVISRLKELSVSYEYSLAVAELEEICSLIAKTEFKDKIKLDFSLVNDMNYYNGIVFNGFINGVYECILFGGRYDKLLKRMGRKGGAIGFALYLDLLENINSQDKEYDVDALIVYSNDISPEEVLMAVDEQIKMGNTVSAQKAIPEKLRYKTLTYLTKEGKQ